MSGDMTCTGDSFGGVVEEMMGKPDGTNMITEEEGEMKYERYYCLDDGSMVIEAYDETFTTL